MRVTIAFIVLAALANGYQAFGQSGSCPNGMCPLAMKTAVRPFAGGEVSGEKDLSPQDKQIVQIEKNALEKWYQGDPSAYIEILGNDVGYFDPSAEKRLDGREFLSKMFEAQRGRVHADKFEMLNTRVQTAGDMAILSFNLLLIENGVPYRWNCTEVYGLQKDGKWKIAHSHWSLTKHLNK
jgi:ketosteroid isomerase-like protein